MSLEPWVFWTLLAASMQAVRTAGQRHLTSEITPLAATLVRYLFGLPFVALWLAYVSSTYLSVEGNTALPSLNLTFLRSAFLAGILQIFATVLLIQLLTLRNFAVGSTYVKSEILLTAIIGYFFFTEAITLIGWVAIIVCVAGLMVVSISKSGGLNSLWNRSALYGLGSGLCFALTSLFLRQASLSLGVEDSMLSAGMTLTYMVILQTMITVVWVRWQQPGEISKVFQQWRPALFVGITSVIGSVGWFTAMTLELASYVKTLGQVEFLLTVLIAIFYFKERPTRPEVVGMLLIISGGIVLLLN
ncbi:MAG: EamA family transporter [bacterium]|nr:DMT family transporter [Gammaproteobacteria bacterium]HIL94554.1 DMT family transporter [Pseudomonadales bacterium]